MGKKIIRAATIGMSLNIFCNGLLKELKEEGYEVVALSSSDADLKEVGEREDVRTIGVAMERRVSPLKDLLSLIKLVSVLKKEKPDMVHSMTPKAGLLCMMAAKMANVPVRVHTFTGLVWPTATGLKRRILIEIQEFHINLRFVHSAYFKHVLNQCTRLLRITSIHLLQSRKITCSQIKTLYTVITLHKDTILEFFIRGLQLPFASNAE